MNEYVVKIDVLADETQKLLEAISGHYKDPQAFKELEFAFQAAFRGLRELAK